MLLLSVCLFDDTLAVSKLLLLLDFCSMVSINSYFSNIYLSHFSIVLAVTVVVVVLVLVRPYDE